MSVLAFLDDKVRAIASTALGRSLLNASNIATAQSLLGLIPGSTVQAYSQTLQQFSLGFASATNDQVPYRLSGSVVWGTPWVPVRHTFSDSDTQIPANARIVAHTGTMTAHRTATLPQSSQVEAGAVIEVRQEGQSYGNCLDLLVVPTGVDSIDGLPGGTGIAMPWGHSTMQFVRNPSNAPYQWSYRATPGDYIGYVYDPSFSGGSSGFASERMQGNNSGTGASANLSATNPVLIISTGTATTGRGGIRTAQLFNLGVGEMSCRARLSGFSALSSGTEAYTFCLGLVSSAVSFPVNHGLYWQYSHNINGGSWQGVCRSNNTESVVNSSVPATSSSSTYVDLAWWLRADGGEARFFINGSQVGNPITSNIPTQAGTLPWVLSLIKSAGTTGRNVNVSRSAVQYKAFSRL